MGLLTICLLNVTKYPIFLFGVYPYIISCKEQYVCGVSTVSLNTSTGLGLTWKSNTQVFWVTTNTHRSGKAMLGWWGLRAHVAKYPQVWAGNESAQGCDSKKNFTGDRNTKLFWWWHKRKTLNSQNMFFQPKETRIESTSASVDKLQTAFVTLMTQQQSS